MKKEKLCYLRGIEFLALILVVLFSLTLISGIEISEVELNPSGDDSGNEWIELYSSSEINLENYSIMNNDGGEINLSKYGIFSGYFIINLNSQWLDNNDEKVLLYDGTELIDETPTFSDTNDNEKTWQLCSPNWRFVDETSEENNDCELNSGEINIELDYPEEVYFEEEFSVTLKINGLDTGEIIDVRMEVYEQETLSEIFNEQEEEWIDGNYYITNISDGEEEIDFGLNIFKEFEGYANLTVKIRDTESEEVLLTEKFDIEVIMRPEDKVEPVSFNNQDKNKSTELGADTIKKESEVVHLNKNVNSGGEEAKQEKELFVSSKERLKNVAFYSFTFFCVILIGLLVLKNKGI